MRSPAASAVKRPGALRAKLRATAGKPVAPKVPGKTPSLAHHLTSLRARGAFTKAK